MLLTAATNCAQLSSYSPLAVSTSMNYLTTLRCALIRIFQKIRNFLNRIPKPRRESQGYRFTLSFRSFPFDDCQSLSFWRYVLGSSRTYHRRLGFYAVITIWRQAAEYTKLFVRLPYLTRVKVMVMGEGRYKWYCARGDRPPH